MVTNARFQLVDVIGHLRNGHGGIFSLRKDFLGTEDHASDPRRELDPVIDCLVEQGAEMSEVRSQFATWLLYKASKCSFLHLAGIVGAKCFSGSQDPVLKEALDTVERERELYYHQRPGEGRRQAIDSLADAQTIKEVVSLIHANSEGGYNGFKWIPGLDRQCS